MAAEDARMPLRRFRQLAAAAVAVLVLSAPLSAHHSTAMFIWGKEVSLKGVTVERWDWTNPHTFLYVRDTTGQRWAFEGMSPNHLVRNGWSKRTLKPGDKIDIGYYALKDGRKGGFDVAVRLPGGKVMRQLEAPSVRPDQDR